MDGSTKKRVSEVRTESFDLSSGHQAGNSSTTNIPFNAFRYEAIVSSDITYHNIRRNSHSAVWTDSIRQFGRIPFGSLDDQISPRLFHRPRGNSCFAWSPTCSRCLLSLCGVSESRSMAKRAFCSFHLPNERTSPFSHPAIVHDTPRSEQDVARAPPPLLQGRGGLATSSEPPVPGLRALWRAISAL